MTEEYEPSPPETYEKIMSSMESRGGLDSLHWDTILEQASRDARLAITTTHTQHKAIAEEVIKNAGCVATPRAVEALASEFREQWEKLNTIIARKYEALAKALPQPKPVVGNTGDEVRIFTTLWIKARATYLTKDGVLLLDRAGAELLEQIGNFGAETAATILNDSQEKTRDVRAAEYSKSPFALSVCKKKQYNLWFDASVVPPVPFAKVLADVLWRDRLAARFTRRDSAGVCEPVLTSLVGASRRGAQIELISGHAELTDFKKQPIGSIRTIDRGQEGPEMLNLQFVSLSALSHLVSQRFFRWLMWQAYEKHWIDEAQNSNIIEIYGGIPALAEAVGGGVGNKAQLQVRQTLETLSALWLKGPTGEGRVFAHYMRSAYRGHQAKIEMHLIGPWRPDYIARELANENKPENKRLVPVPLPKLMPPFSGRENEWAAQANLQLLVLRELRQNAPEYLKSGGVPISPKRWDQLADEASVPKRTVPDVISAYSAGDKDYPPFLSDDGKRYALTDHYAAERRAILAAADDIANGKRRGRASARKRRGDKSTTTR